MRSEYRSSIRSRTLIRSALLNLMHERPFDSITVTDVVKQADINRGTFYSHYRSTFDVIRKMEEEIAEDILSLFRSVEVPVFCRTPQNILSDVSGYLGKDGGYPLVFSVDMGGAFISDVREGLELYFLQPQLGAEYREASSFAAAAIAAKLGRAAIEPAELQDICRNISSSVVKLLSEYF